MSTIKRIMVTEIPAVADNNGVLYGNGTDVLVQPILKELANLHTPIIDPTRVIQLKGVTPITSIFIDFGQFSPAVGEKILEVIRYGNLLEFL